MPYEMLVGLEVVDDDLYDKYREEMTPILKQYGGGFNFDFKISETLKPKDSKNINRVFTIYFEDQESMDSFFENEQYQQIKQEYFVSSVRNTTIIAGYQT